MNDVYKNAVGLIVQLLNLNPIKAAAIYDYALSISDPYDYSDNSSTESLVLENCIHSYYGERESLIGSLEILVVYGNSKRLDDPFPTINRALQEIFDIGSSVDDPQSCVNSLLKIVINNMKRIEALTPLPNDSTTQVFLFLLILTYA